MEVRKQWRLQLANEVIKGLEKRKMVGHYCETKTAAVQKALALTKNEGVVAWGGSETLTEIGLLEELSKQEGLQVLDRDQAKSLEEKREIQLKSFAADYYFMSTNAITKDGVLLNVDGTGNRLACLLYGPKKVIIIAGMNKVTATVEEGISRLRNQAAPPNAIRLKQNTPCAKVGYCMDCHSPDCVCGDFVITRHCREEDRIEVILVGEDCGY